jgi:deoxyadenosine/deoxycytidine kinase
MIRSPKGIFNPEGQKAYEDLKSRFSAWRSSVPKGKRKVPEELWASAVELTEFYSLSSVAVAMGIDYASLKKRILQRNKTFLEPVSCEKFVEISCPVYPDSVSPANQTAEIIDSSGSVLKLYFGSVAEIIRAFKQS